MIIPLPVMASGPIINSNRMTTAVTVDGASGTGEWDDAAYVHVTTGTMVNFEYYLYVKNDDKWIYVCLDAVGDTTQDSGDEGILRFDTGHDEVLTHEGEDSLHSSSDYINRHFLYNSTSGMWSSIHCTSTSGVPFSHHGRDESGMVAAIGFGPSPNSGTSHRIYEYKIPMALGDLNAYPGYILGMWTYIWDRSIMSESCWPGDSSVYTPSSWGDIVLDDCTIYVKGDYSTIQEAIDNAVEGDTIIVESGTYKEALTIDKRLNIQGQSKDTTTIDGMSSSTAVYMENAAEDSKLSGFTITNASTGIEPWNGAEISDCLIHSCSSGAIFATSLTLTSSPSITIKDCICHNNAYGISIWRAANILIENTYCYNNEENGIIIKESENVTLSSCITHNNTQGVNLRYVTNATVTGCTSYDNADDGIHLDYTDHTSIIDCETYNNSNDGITLSDSNHVKIEDCDSHNNGDDGVNLWYSYSSKIASCNCYENSNDGFFLWYSDDALLRSCDSYDNGDDGIELNTLENSRITSSNLYGNTDGGLILSHSDNIHVHGCDVYNHSTGIYMEYSHSNTLCNTTSHDNDNHGMYIYWTNFQYVSNSAFYNNTYDGVNAKYSNSTLILCNITDNDDDGITVENSDIQTRYCNIEDNGDYGLYETGTCKVDARECWWGDESGPYNHISNPSGIGDRCDVLDFKPWKEEPATYQSLISELRCQLSSLPWRVVYPDQVTPKPLDCVAASTSDWLASAFATTKLHYLMEGLDTNATFVNQITGQAMGDPGSGIISFGGPFVNPIVKRAEDESTPACDRAPIMFVNEGDKGTFKLKNGTDIPDAELPWSNVNNDKDLFIIEVFKDGDERNLMLCYGLGWKGTYAAGKYFDKEIYPNLVVYQDSWIIVKWEDANGDGFVNNPREGDSYTLIASGN